MFKTLLKVGPATYSKAGTVSIGFYQCGAVALVIESNSGIEAKATVNMPEVDLQKDQIILKNWSENTGIPEALVKAGLVEITSEAVSNGFVAAPIATMKPELLSEVEKARVA